MLKLTFCLANWQKLLILPKLSSLSQWWIDPLALRDGNPPVIHPPVTRGHYYSQLCCWFNVNLNKLLNNQLSGQWFEMPWCSTDITVICHRDICVVYRDLIISIQASEYSKQTGLDWDCCHRHWYPGSLHDLNIISNAIDYVKSSDPCMTFERVDLSHICQMTAKLKNKYFYLKIVQLVKLRWMSAAGRGRI